MCLSVPSKVVEIHAGDAATVETMGVQRQVSLALMPEAVELGDYVLIHVGFAMNKIDEADALESLALYQEMIALMDAPHESN
ncbi:HypC/HybG/HupF family hydrogenase formation chaperone [Hydrogenovibrio sp. SC-1]|uniref:HypC/HybG/HupF family hydrogenase formation chaperone n=1 Tax=Hydrogenovibrio sp. SC-1 TaxID=2065820 RepID=UPI000C7CA9C3|nr:HypC/HybG/HupF family hydrogenase formation chaperone [Hydrogenovibrio sp. SC-1]PLA74528.1 HypC/HybG/HupF family hydrogenase formation chaperone [Hydrogenovibrio sp. SC-1]